MSKQAIQLTDGSNNIFTVSAESENGYCKMADGTLICWSGSCVFPASSVGMQTVTIDFPVAFTSNPAISLTWKDNSSVFTYFEPMLSVSSYTYYRFNASAIRKNEQYPWYFSYIAIGRWR